MYWSLVVDRRTSLKGHRCEDCGATDKELIGHHVLPRGALKRIQMFRSLKGEKALDLIDFCRLRCRECETKAHKSPGYIWGNSPEEQKRVLAWIEKNGYTIDRSCYQRSFRIDVLVAAGDG
ncbi:MAG TPA: hypothetical protein PLH22_00250 [Candidatus Colwellbacteria bacterium]|nr:hypothetical protein [Candidatus Colwellbacteria bacterium]